MPNATAEAARLDPERKDDDARLRDSPPVRLPNATTRRALRSAEARRQLTSRPTLDELFADLFP